MIKYKEISLNDNINWNNLINQSNTATFFQTKSWLKTINKHFPADYFLWAIYKKSNLLAIAPFSKNKKSKKINFMGTAPVLGKELITDFGDIIIKEEKEKEVWKYILSQLGKENKGWGLELNFIREESPTYTILQDLGCQYRKIDTSPSINLPENWDKYLYTLRKKDRHELRRKIRRLEAQNAVEICDEEKDTDSFLRLMKLSSQQKQKFLSSKMKDFFKSILTNISPQIIFLCFLKLEGNKIASVLAFNYKKDMLLYNSGFDPEYHHLSPGFLLKAYLVKRSINLKLKRFDFLRGDERYKYNLGGSDRNLYRFILKL